MIAQTGNSYLVISKKYFRKCLTIFEIFENKTFRKFPAIRYVVLVHGAVFASDNHYTIHHFRFKVVGLTIIVVSITKFNNHYHVVISKIVNITLFCSDIRYTVFTVSYIIYIRSYIYPISFKVFSCKKLFLTSKNLFFLTRNYFLLIYLARFVFL